MSRLLVAAFYAFTPLDDEQRETLLNALPPRLAMATCSAPCW